MLMERSLLEDLAVVKKMHVGIVETGADEHPIKIVKNRVFVRADVLADL